MAENAGGIPRDKAKVEGKPEEKPEDRPRDEKIYYRSISTDFRIDLGELVVEPKIYAPTAAGLGIIAKKYNKLYGIDIQLFDSSQLKSADFPELAGDNLLHRFRAFKASFDFSQMEKKARIGVILLHGNHHAVPVLLSREESGLYMIVFDSTSGARTKGYWSMASLFPQFTFLLNIGTRQADTGSCFTDAIYTLKDALRSEKITGSYLRKNYAAQRPDCPHREHSVVSFLRNRVKPENFYLFRMPSVLLKTTQRSQFLEDSHANMDEVIHCSGITLRQHLEHHRIRVSYLSKNLEGDANTFLNVKAVQHKEMIDNYRRARAWVSFFKCPDNVADNISEQIENYLPYKLDF